LCEGPKRDLWTLIRGRKITQKKRRRKKKHQEKHKEAIPFGHLFTKRDEDLLKL